MSTDLDTTRIVRSWLRTDEHESADRVLDDVLALLDTTPQHRSWWPARRIVNVNNVARLLVAAAAVVVVAFAGYNLLPAQSGVGGGPAATASRSPEPSPTATPPPSPSPTPVAEFPPGGPLAIGTYPAVVAGVPLSFSVPASGWSSGLSTISKGEYGQTDGISIWFWLSTPENVYVDPCAHTPLEPPASATAVDLAAAVAAIPGTDLVSGPSSANVGGRPAQHVAITIREDLGCDPQTAYLWYDEETGGASGGWRWAGQLGQTIQVWIVDVDGKLVWIDGETFKGAGPGPAQDIQQVIDSIAFE